MSLARSYLGSLDDITNDENIPEEGGDLILSTAQFFEIIQDQLVECAQRYPQVQEMIKEIFPRNPLAHEIYIELEKIYKDDDYMRRILEKIYSQIEEKMNAELENDVSLANNLESLSIHSTTFNLNEDGEKETQDEAEDMEEMNQNSTEEVVQQMTCNASFNCTQPYESENIPDANTSLQLFLQCNDGNDDGTVIDSNDNAQSQIGRNSSRTIFEEELSPKNSANIDSAESVKLPSQPVKEDDAIDHKLSISAEPHDRSIQGDDSSRTNSSSNTDGDFDGNSTTQIFSMSLDGEGRFSEETTKISSEEKSSQVIPPTFEVHDGDKMTQTPMSLTNCCNESVHFIAFVLSDDKKPLDEKTHQEVTATELGEVSNRREDDIEGKEIYPHVKRIKENVVTRLKWLLIATIQMAQMMRR